MKRKGSLHEENIKAYYTPEKETPARIPSEDVYPGRQSGSQAAPAEGPPPPDSVTWPSLVCPDGSREVPTTAANFRHPHLPANLQRRNPPSNSAGAFLRSRDRINRSSKRPALSEIWMRRPSGSSLNGGREKPAEAVAARGIPTESALFSEGLRPGGGRFSGFKRPLVSVSPENASSLCPGKGPVARILLLAIQAYQAASSALGIFPRSCRFFPSCSRYTAQAILRYGAYEGMKRGIQRLLRCHPLHPGGWDPVEV